MQSTSCGEGDGIPLQYSCLDNPMDGGASWATVHGVTKSWTILKQLRSSSSRAILIPACASSSLPFRMMYSACKLNKQDDNIQPWPILFPIWTQTVVPCLVQTVASWPAYRFRGRQVRWSGIPIFLKFSTFCCDIHKGFSVSQITSPMEMGITLPIS